MMINLQTDRQESWERLQRENLCLLIYNSKNKIDYMIYFTWTDRRTNRQNDRHTYKQKVETDYRGRIFASLYIIIKNKVGDFFSLGQNQCHSPRVKKTYFSHTFHLTPKSFLVGWKVTFFDTPMQNGHRAWQLKNLFSADTITLMGSF